MVNANEDSSRAAIPFARSQCVMHSEHVSPDLPHVAHGLRLESGEWRARGERPEPSARVCYRASMQQLALRRESQTLLLHAMQMEFFGLAEPGRGARRAR